MARPYHALRRTMMARSIKIDDIAAEFHCTRQTVSNKLRNITPWTLDEIWIVMDLLEINPKSMAYYFPRLGKNE